MSSYRKSLIYYVQVRRQGRNFGTGEIFSFKRPLPVRNIAASGRALSPSRKELKRVEAAPVFNLNDMLKKEAAKLKAKVQEASLAAAKAAEEAEQKLDEMVEKVMVETDATREEVENIVSNFQPKHLSISRQLTTISNVEYMLLIFFTLQIEEAVEEGIEEAEKIIEEEIEESEVEDEIFGAEKSSNSDKKDKEELSKEIINLINDNDEPSKDIDLGSVQEV